MTDEMIEFIKNHCTLSIKSDSDNVYAVIWLIVLLLLYLFYTYCIKALYDPKPQQLGTLFTTLLVSPGLTDSSSDKAGFDNIQPEKIETATAFLPNIDMNETKTFIETKIKSLLFMFFGIRFPNKLDR